VLAGNHLASSLGNLEEAGVVGCALRCRGG
jgi:hypothetical protein